MDMSTLIKTEHDNWKKRMMVDARTEPCSGVQTAETIRHCIRLGLEVEGLPDLTCINVVK